MKKLSVEEIRTVLKASPFLGEGPLQMKARLAAQGIRVGKNRVLRLEGWCWFFAAAGRRKMSVVDKADAWGSVRDAPPILDGSVATGPPAPVRVPLSRACDSRRRVR